MERKPYDVVFEYRVPGIPGLSRYHRTVEAYNWALARNTAKSKRLCPISNPKLLKFVSSTRIPNVYLAHYVSADLLPKKVAVFSHEFLAESLEDATEKAYAYLPTLQKHLKAPDLDLDDIMELRQETAEDVIDSSQLDRSEEVSAKWLMPK